MSAVECDEGGAMLPAALEAALARAAAGGRRPFFVGLTAGTTVTGAFDPIKVRGRTPSRQRNRPAVLFGLVQVEGVPSGRPGLRLQGGSLFLVETCAPFPSFPRALQEIAEICARHGVWLHVDGCWGASLLLSRKHR